MLSILDRSVAEIEYQATDTYSGELGHMSAVSNEEKKTVLNQNQFFNPDKILKKCVQSNRGLRSLNRDYYIKMTVFVCAVC